MLDFFEEVLSFNLSNQYNIMYIIQFLVIPVIIFFLLFITVILIARQKQFMPKAFLIEFVIVLLILSVLNYNVTYPMSKEMKELQAALIEQLNADTSYSKGRFTVSLPSNNNRGIMSFIKGYQQVGVAEDANLILKHTAPEIYIYSSNHAEFKGRFFPSYCPSSQSHINTNIEDANIIHLKFYTYDEMKEKYPKLSIELYNDIINALTNEYLLDEESTFTRNLELLLNDDK